MNSTETIHCNTLTVGDLKEILNKLPDDMDVIIGSNANHCEEVSVIQIRKFAIGLFTEDLK